MPLPKPNPRGTDGPWDDVLFPQTPADPGGGGGTGGGGCAEQGLMPEDVGPDGNWRTAGPGECISKEEWNRRVNLNIKNNPNGREPKTDPTGTGPRAPGGPAQYPFTTVPGFNAPNFDWNEEFRAPSYLDAQQDPGYQFRLDEGRKALEQSAAGRGTLRTGGTLKDILNYGQSAASQEYGNVFDRYARGYDTRFSTAKDKYNFKYQGAKDTYAPKLFEWQTKTAFGTNAAQRAWERAYEDYMRSTLSAADILNAGRPR